MLTINLKLTFIFFIILTIFSCGRTPGKAPSKFYQQDLKNASPDFKQGWEDGCETGMSSGSNSFNQMFYKVNKQDGYKFTYSSDYKTAWSNAFWFCYRSDYVDQKSTPSSSFFKGLM
jgi:hypothetical protein